MCLMGGEIFYYSFTTNILLTLSVTEFLKIGEYLAKLEAKI